MKPVKECKARYDSVVGKGEICARPAGHTGNHRLIPLKRDK